MKTIYVTRDRLTGTVIDEFPTREAAEAAIREYEAQDKADGNYEPDFYEIVEPVYATDGGDYTLIALVGEGGEADEHIDLYVGRHTDGHTSLIASDNASMWVVGDEDDAQRNYDQFDLLDDRIGALDIDAIRAVDADLAEWIKERQEAAEVYAEG